MSEQLIQHLAAVELRAHDFLNNLEEEVTSAAASIAAGKTNVVLESIPAFVAGTIAFAQFQTRSRNKGVVARLLSGADDGTSTLIFTNE